MVDAGLNDVLPLCPRVPVIHITTISARPVEQGVLLILISMCVLDSESHGALILHRGFQPRIVFPIPSVNHAKMFGLRPASTIPESAAGQDVVKKNYTETLAEIRKYVTIP